jgi:hypothetical protein
MKKTYLQNFSEKLYTDITKYGIATQESTGYGGVANRAIDGNAAGKWNRYITKFRYCIEVLSITINFNAASSIIIKVKSNLNIKESTVKVP